MRKNPTDLHVGAKLRQARLARGMTQQVLAAALPVSFQLVHKYETGFTRISVSRLMQFAGALKVPVSYFFDDLDPNAGADSPISSAAVRYAKMLDEVPDTPIKRQILVLLKACHSEAMLKRDRRLTAERRRRNNGVPQAGDRRERADRRGGFDIRHSSLSPPGSPD